MSELEESTVILLSSLRTGRQYEIACLGYCPQEGFVPEYRNFDRSKIWVTYRQPVDYDPRKPEHGLNEDLFDKVQKMLPKRWRKFLQFYIAVGSSFDWWHGVDAFFYLNGIIVTLDWTIDLGKQFKADNVVTPKEMDPEKGRISPVLVKQIANQLIRRYQLAQQR